MSEDFKPFGPEWAKEMKKLPKDALVEMLRGYIVKAWPVELIGKCAPTVDMQYLDPAKGLDKIPDLTVDTIEHKIVPVIILDYTSGTAIVVEADVLLEDEDMIEAINTKYGYSLRLKDIDWMELLDRAIYLQTTINIK